MPGAGFGKVKSNKQAATGGDRNSQKRYTDSVAGDLSLSSPSAVGDLHFAPPSATMSAAR